MKTSLLLIITPTNIPEEKRKFFSLSNYNPIFKYRWDQINFKEYYQKHPSKKSLVESIINQDIAAIVENAKGFFRTDITDENVNIAKEALLNNPIKTENITSEDIIKAFQKAFEELHINYITEIKDRHGFSMRPNHFTNKLIISKYYKPQFETLDSSVKHEVTHIIRRVNWKYNNVKRSNYFLPTEEGLASFMGDFHSNDKGGAFYQHAAEYLATKVSLSSSFRELFEFFKSKGYSNDAAWIKSVRHKIGFIDTSTPGDIMKPSMYFYNEQKIRELNKEDLLKLFIGKLKLEDIKKYDHYFGEIKEEDLVNFYNL